MANDVPPNPPPDGPIPGFKQGAWIADKYLGLTPMQIIFLGFGVLFALFIGMFGMVYYDARNDRNAARQEYTDTILQLRRDRDSIEEKNAKAGDARDEKWRVHDIELVRMIQANCAQREAAAQERSDKHMAEAMDLLRKLNAAIEMLNIGVRKISGPRVGGNSCPEIEIAPMPRARGDQSSAVAGRP